MAFATNCFIARRDLFLGREYVAFFDAIDASGGVYVYRWGDAVIHMLAAALLLPRSAVMQFSTLAYWHQGTVILPHALRPNKSDFLGPAALPPSMFAGADRGEARA